jgi:hypothetical protein
MAIFGLLDPVFVSVSKAFASKIMKMYLLTGLLLFTCNCDAIIPVME